MSRTKKLVKRKSLQADKETFLYVKKYAKKQNVTMIDAISQICIEHAIDRTMITK
jgi:hypothetical protein